MALVWWGWSRFAKEKRNGRENGRRGEGGLNGSEAFLVFFATYLPIL